MKEPRKTYPDLSVILPQAVAKTSLDKNRIIAEYALRDMKKPIGVSEYELTRALPESLKSALPTIEEIERELSKEASGT